MERGIEQGTVETLQEMELSKEQAVELIQKRFSFSMEEAVEVVERYWKKQCYKGCFFG